MLQHLLHCDIKCHPLLKCQAQQSFIRLHSDLLGTVGPFKAQQVQIFTTPNGLSWSSWIQSLHEKRKPSHKLWGFFMALKFAFGGGFSILLYGLPQYYLYFIISIGYCYEFSSFCNTFLCLFMNNEIGHRTYSILHLNHGRTAWCLFFFLARYVALWDYFRLHISTVKCNSAQGRREQGKGGTVATTKGLSKKNLIKCMCINSNRNGGKKIGNLSLFSVHTTLFLFGLFGKQGLWLGGRYFLILTPNRKCY